MTLGAGETFAGYTILGVVCHEHGTRHGQHGVPYSASNPDCSNFNV